MTAREFVRKEDAPCCTAHRDRLGRLPVGFCPGTKSAPCLRRVLRDVRYGKDTRAPR